MYARTNNNDTYQQVTDEVIRLLEKGEIVWQRGWNKFGLPQNISTGNTYRGWNVIWLNFVGIIHGYKTPFYLTFKQAQAMGGKVKAGSKGHLITYCDTYRSNKKFITVKNTKTGEESKEPAMIFVLKSHRVFNLDQTEGIPYPAMDALFRTNAERIAACERVIEEMPQRPRMEHGGDRAYYVPSEDYVRLPVFEQFKTNEGYYKTAFHELAHSTGHQSRLNREELMNSDGFGNEMYSKEELTAEFAAAFLCAICGIEQPLIENCAGYIQGWLDALKNDKTLLLKAASQAQKAADFILNNLTKEQEQPESESVEKAA